MRMLPEVSPVPRKTTYVTLGTNGILVTLDVIDYTP